jgi:hypothetical protein
MRALRILLRWPLRAWLHRRCLRRIALLERELRINQFNYVQTFGPEDFALTPGARWAVNDHRKVEWLSDDERDFVVFPAPTNHVEIIKHKYDVMEQLFYGELSRQGLLFSGAAAAMSPTNRRR